MRKWTAFFVLLLLATALSAQTSVPGWPLTGGGSGGGSSTAGTTGPQQNNWQVQTTSCGSNTNCTQIFGDGKFIIDATTNSTNTITCVTTNDCNFTAADVGKSVWVVQRGGGSGLFSATNLICGNSVPVPTITTVNNAQSITISGSACTASISGLAVLVWGHKDGATLAAMNPGCTSVYFPNNVNILDDQPWLITVPTCASASGVAQATGVPNLNVYGGSPSTQFIITPDFNYAGCTGTGATSGGVCIGSGVSGFTNFIVWGTGTTNASNSNCASGAGKTILSQNPLGGNLINVNMSGVCPGTGLTGIELNGIDDQWYLGGAQNVGTTACAFSKAAMVSKGLDCLNTAVASTAGYGADVLSSGQLADEGTFLWAGMRVHGQLTTRNSHFIGGNSGGSDSANAITVYSGGTHILDGDFIGQDSGTTNIGAVINSGGTLVARNTKFGAAGGSNITISVSGIFLDKGGNTQTTATSQAQINLSLTSGDQTLYGFCTGVATSSVTILPYGLGSTSTTTCTATGTNTGWVAPRAGTLRSLTLSSSATSVSVAATVFINHNGTDAASAVTCTMTAATNCTDYTHNASYAAGDIITVRMATGAAETAANLRVNLLAW